MNFRSNGLRALLFIFGVVLLGGTAEAVTQERIVKDYLLAAGAGDKGAVFNSFHTGDVEAFRARIMKALEKETAEGRREIRDRLFGTGTTIDELRRLTPPNFLLAMVRRLEMPMLPAKKVDIIDIVDENSETVHALARVWPDEDKKGSSRLALVTLRRFGKNEWRVGLPEPFLARVDAALEGSGQDRASLPEKVTGTNSPEILQLIDSGSKVLREGNCTSFFTIFMSPNFRASKSEKALKTLITQCERNIDTREMYVSALEIARGMSPEIQNNGMRAVYDMRGQGFPFETYSIEKIGERWYIAE
jgi:hypothetical protein